MHVIISQAQKETLRFFKNLSVSTKVYLASNRFKTPGLD